MHVVISVSLFHSLFHLCFTYSLKRTQFWFSRSLDGYVLQSIAQAGHCLHDLIRINLALVAGSHLISSSQKFTFDREAASSAQSIFNYNSNLFIQSVAQAHWTPIQASRPALPSVHSVKTSFCEVSIVLSMFACHVIGCLWDSASCRFDAQYQIEKLRVTISKGIAK